MCTDKKDILYEWPKEMKCNRESLVKDHYISMFHNYTCKTHRRSRHQICCHRTFQSSHLSQSSVLRRTGQCT